MQSPTHTKTQFITVAAVLTAVGIVIPMVMPFKIVIGPASYTLASHVPVDMAMFVSPLVAFVVALGTAIGFQVAGFPLVIVGRAMTHMIYATVGAYFLSKRRDVLAHPIHRFTFSFALNFLHALGESLIVYSFMSLGLAVQNPNYLTILFAFVGLGTVIHGMVDFEIGYQFTKILGKRTHRTFIHFA